MSHSFNTIPPLLRYQSPWGDGVQNDWTRSVPGNTLSSQSGGCHSGGGGGGTKAPRNVWYVVSGMAKKKLTTKNYPWLELRNHRLCRKPVRDRIG